MVTHVLSRSFGLCILAFLLYRTIISVSLLAWEHDLFVSVSSATLQTRTIRLELHNYVTLLWSTISCPLILHQSFENHLPLSVRTAACPTFRQDLACMEQSTRFPAANRKYKQLARSHTGS